MVELEKHFEAFDPCEYTRESRPPSADVIIGVNQDGTPKTARYPGAFTSTKLTPYEQSPESTSQAAQALAEDPDALHNDRKPFYAIKNQKPEHRIAILLKAQGNTNREIAATLGLTPVAVANILKQPWARKQLLEEINRAGRNEVIQVFKGAALDVAEAVVDIVNDPEAKASDKISASHLILDRLFGKATQPMDINLDGSKLKTMSDAELLRIATGQSN